MIPAGNGLLHEPRTSSGARILVLLHHPEPSGDFGIGFDHPAEVLSEAILVHLVAGLDVPQTARVRADLVGKHDSHRLTLPQPPGFDLEIDQSDADAEE